MVRTKETEMPLPQWAAGPSFDEVDFCLEFLCWNKYVYAEGSFFSQEGRVPEDRVRKEVFDYLSCFVCSGVSSRMRGLMDVLKLVCQEQALSANALTLHFANGTYHVAQDLLTEQKQICRCRFPVAFNREAPAPRRWLDFLEELLEPEDILTLQEYLGYCLLPVNYAQKMLLILGSGGEGKSRIGIVMQALLGEGACNGSLAKLEASPFARADLQHRLLMVDDDLRLGGLPTTNYIKSLITSEQPMDLERKGIQSYQARLYCRFLAFGNGNLKALHDRSFGFFRRQIILTAKPLNPNRVNDPYLAQRIIRDELEGVMLWCVEGLMRLMGQNLEFTLSKKARANLAQAQQEGNNVTSFLESEGYVTLDRSRQCSSRRLYDSYREWCEDNAEQALAPKSFSAAMMDLAWKYGYSYSNNIRQGEKCVRGFRGIAPLLGF